jgi:hypothetical protein
VAATSRVLILGPKDRGPTVRKVTVVYGVRAMGVLDRRRADASPPRSMTAAATKVHLADSAEQVKRQLGKRQDWQTEAWGYIRSGDVGEVKQLIRFLGNGMSKLRLFPATMAPDADPDDDPVWVMAEESDVSEKLARAATEELARLGGLAPILRMLTMNVESVGECYLVGEAERPPTVRDDGTLVPGRAEEWSIKSISELVYEDDPTRPGRKRAIVFDDPENRSKRTGRALDLELDTVIRIYEPDAEWSQLADCALAGVLGECQALRLLRRQVRVEARSRVFAGFLLIGNDLSFGVEDPTQAEDGPEARRSKFLEDLEEAMGEADTDEDAGSVLIPAIVRGDPEALDKVRHLTFGRGGGTELDARINARVEAIARGMNAPVEVVMGHQRTTFANADQIDEDTYEDYFQSRAVFVVDALTVGYLHPQLLDRGFGEEEVARVFVWFDPSELVAQPDPGAAADSGHDRMVISDAAWRRVKGFSEEDAPDDAEVAARLDRRPAPASEFVSLALPLGETHANGHANGNGTKALTAATMRGNPDAGLRLVEIDRELRSRLLVLADRTLERALERAGARLRSSATGKLASELRKVQPLQACAVLGREAVTAAVSEDALLADAFDAMEDSFMRWGATAQRQALDAASRVLGRMSVADRDRLGLRQADDLAEAWRWARSALTTLAGARLFDPDPGIDALGEVDASGGRVPPGLIRRAMARAGGAVALETSGEGDAWLGLVNGGTRPMGGIGTGELVRDTLLDSGARIEGYQWVYGPALRQRPFEPHLALDGTTFENFDDSRLANYNGWPSVPFFMPGDHDGCVCDVAPVILGPSGEVVG